MDDLAELVAWNLEEYSHAAAGFGIGAATTYISKLNAQRKGREIFSEGPEQEWYERVLEEDPLYDEENFSEGRLMEFYYDNYDTLSKNSRQGIYSFVSTGLVDALETLSMDTNFIDFAD